MREDKSVNRVYYPEISAIFSAGNVLIKTISVPDDNNHDRYLDYNLRQIANPKTFRPVKPIDEKQVDRFVKWNPFARSWIVKPVTSVGRGGQKNTKYTKKTSTTLLPKDGVMNVFKPKYGDSIVGLMFDLEKCNLKNDKYVFDGNIDSKNKPWLRRYKNPERSESLTSSGLKKLKSKIDAERLSKKNPDFNEILACVSCESVVGVFVYNASLEDKLTAIYVSAQVYIHLNKIVPIVILSSKNGYYFYSNVSQNEDLATAKKQDNLKKFYELIFQDKFKNFVKYENLAALDDGQDLVDEADVNKSIKCYAYLPERVQALVSKHLVESPSGIDNALLDFTNFYNKFCNNNHNRFNLDQDMIVDGDSREQVCQSLLDKSIEMLLYIVGIFIKPGYKDEIGRYVEKNNDVIRWSKFQKSCSYFDENSQRRVKFRFDYYIRDFSDLNDVEILFLIKVCYYFRFLNSGSSKRKVEDFLRKHLLEIGHAAPAILLLLSFLGGINCSEILIKSLNANVIENLYNNGVFQNDELSIYAGKMNKDSEGRSYIEGYYSLLELDLDLVSSCFSKIPLSVFDELDSQAASNKLAQLESISPMLEKFPVNKYKYDLNYKELLNSNQFNLVRGKLLLRKFMHVESGEIADKDVKCMLQYLSNVISNASLPESVLDLYDKYKSHKIFMPNQRFKLSLFTSSSSNEEYRKFTEAAQRKFVSLLPEAISLSKKEYYMSQPLAQCSEDFCKTLASYPLSTPEEIELLELKPS